MALIRFTHESDICEPHHGSKRYKCNQFHCSGLPKQSSLAVTDCRLNSEDPSESDLSQEQQYGRVVNTPFRDRQLQHNADFTEGSISSCGLRYKLHELAN